MLAASSKLMRTDHVMLVGTGATSLEGQQHYMDFSSIVVTHCKHYVSLI